jgi:hypothetical protein
MDDNTLLTLATGPTSSLILLLGMGLGTWRFFSNVIVIERKVGGLYGRLDALKDAS